MNKEKLAAASTSSATTTSITANINSGASNNERTKIVMRRFGETFISNAEKARSTENKATVAAVNAGTLTSPTSPNSEVVSAHELSQMKRESDPQSSRFADYFVICGLDLDTGLEPDRFAGKKV